MMTEHRFVSFDGTPIFYFQNIQPHSKAFVLIVHGMGEHGGRYRSLSQDLAAQGISTVCPDLRGYGRSGGRRGHVRAFLEYHRDLDGLVGFLRKTHTQAPWFMLGHSYGGLIASSYAAQESRAKFSGLILSSPLFGIYGKIPAWKHWLCQGLSRIVPTYTEKTQLNAQNLSHDKQITTLYAQDPLVHYAISARLYAELISILARTHCMAHHLSMPLLLLQAGEDRIVKKESGFIFFEQVSSNDKTLRVYDGFYHEILNEVGRRQVIADLTDWILKRVGF